MRTFWAQEEEGSHKAMYLSRPAYRLALSCGPSFFSPMKRAPARGSGLPP